jgi:hypothetical protein
MSHLKEVNRSYLRHLYHAWKVAGILIVHGLFPNIWETKASDNLCQQSHPKR